MGKGHKKRKKSLQEVMADDLMQTDPVTDHQNAACHLTHLPGVDHEEKLIGLIERHDVLAAYLQFK